MTGERREPFELDELARAWAEADAADAASAGAPGGEAAASDPERIWRAATGAASAEEVAALALAAASDPELATAWRLARELGAQESAEGADAPTAPARAGRFRPERTAWRPWPLVAALAAAVLVVVGLRLLAPAGPADEPAWRSGDAPGLAVPAGEEGARRSRRAFAVHWQADADPSTRYTVRVTTHELELVYEASDLVGPEATVPEAALARWPAGTTFYWQVEARAPDGPLLASPAVEIVLAD